MIIHFLYHVHLRQQVKLCWNELNLDLTPIDHPIGTGKYILPNYIKYTIAVAATPVIIIIIMNIKKENVICSISYMIMFWSVFRQLFFGNAKSACSTQPLTQ